MREDWSECLLGEISSKITKGSTPTTYGYKYQKEGINFIKIENVIRGRIDKKSIYQFISEEAHESQKRSQLEEGDVLFSIAGTIGETCLITKDILPANTNQAFAIISGFNKALDANFLRKQLDSFVSRKLKDKARGGAMNNVSLTDLKELNLVIPPLAEQNSIISKIEELFSDLDKGIADLKKAQDQLKVYRQAVLKKAFENLEKETTLEEIKEDSLIGLVRASGLQNSNGEGTAYLKMDKIDMIGNVDLEDLVYVETNEDEIEKYALKTGDILLNTRNSYELVGKTGIVRNINKTVVFNNNIMRIRVNESYDPYFICYQLISPFVRKQMDKFKKATTSVCALYQRNLFPLKLKVTNIKEQHQIVQEIESRLSVCDKVEESITESLEKATALRQSILKKAFEGTLLSEAEIAACKAAPDYEPASVLLEKIKAEKKK